MPSRLFPLAVTEGLMGGKNGYIVKIVKNQGLKKRNPVWVNYRGNPRSQEWSLRVFDRGPKEATMNVSEKGYGVAVLRGLYVVLCSAMLLFVVESPAQGQSLLTSHVRQAVMSKEAKFLNRLPETQTLRIDIVLPLRDHAGLEKFLQEAYDPASPTYRHFLTVPEFAARFGPSQDDYDAVVRFAKQNGFTVVGGSRDAMDVQVEGSVTTIEAAFNVSMGVYQHPTENRTFFAPDREPTVTLPFPLWHISGLDNYSLPRPALVHGKPSENPNATTGSGPSASFLGSDMRAAYYGSGSLTGTGQSIGLLEFYGYDIADLNAYYTNVGQTRAAAVTGISTDGTSLTCIYPSCDDLEQTLDMTQALGMAPGITTLYVYVGSTDTAILGSMSSHSPLPSQLSSSWTWTPPDPSTDDPFFQKMAAQGQSYFQASGDSKAWSSSNDLYPSEDANVICVGGTDLQTSSAGGPWSSETAWVDSGGGISPSHLAIPSWQQLAGVINSSNKGSTTYRNGPDVSANADFTFYVCGDQTTCTANYYGGTSFAAPMWAGYIALANQQAKTNGDPVVGFINPAIYPIGVSSSYNTDFHDVTSGSNGFPAVIGYDLATGWGSPNGAALINALAASSSPNFTISASPSSQSVAPGGNTSYTVTIGALNGYTGTVNLSANGLPAGASASFAPASVTSSGTSTMSVTVGSATAPGSYSLTITGTDSVSSTLTHSTQVTLVVTGTPDFSISASPSSQTVVQGGGTTYTATVAPLNGFTGTVMLGVSGLPSGTTGVFSPTSVTGSGSSTLTVTTSTSTPAGSYPLTLTGTSGSLSHNATVTLVVNSSSSPDFTIAATPSSVTVSPGSLASYTDTVTALNGFTGKVTFSVSGLPSGGRSQFSPASVTGSGSVTMHIGTSTSTPAGTYALTVTGTSGSLQHSTTVTLVVSGGGGSGSFTISVSPASQTVTRGSNATYTVTITPSGGFNGIVTFRTMNVPSGATASFSPASVTGAGTSTLTISTTAGTTTGTFTVSVGGVSGTITKITTVALIVQ